MELYRLLRALIHYWYIPIILAAVGFGSGYFYSQQSLKSTAETTVAVVESAVTRAPISQQAQVTFSSVAESYRVAERVIRRLGLNMSPKDFKDEISVKLSKSLVANLVAPLYLVEVKARDPEDARKYANAVVEEASQVFSEINSVDRDTVDNAFRAEEERLRVELTQAQQRLLEFEQQHEAWMLPAVANGQLGTLLGIRQTSLQSDSFRNQNAALLNEYQAGRAAAEAERNRLRALQSEYDRLATAVELARANWAQSSGREQELAFSVPNTTLHSAAQEYLSMAQGKFSAAQQELDYFRRVNRVGDLPGELATQTALANDFQRQIISLSVPPDRQEEALASQQAEFERLSGLFPEYTMLSSRVSALQGQISLTQGRKMDLVLNGIVFPSSQVKVLDSARIKPDAFGSIIYAVIGAVLGSFASLLIVYLAAYFDRTPNTNAEVEDLVGVPVLARVPKAF